MKSVSARQDVALQALTSMPNPIEIGDPGRQPIRW